MAIDSVDLAVVGAGPAGLNAAIEAARVGVRVAVIDEAPAPGGQIYRSLPREFRVTDRGMLGREYERGQRLAARAAGMPIQFIGSTTVWGWFDRGVLELATGSSSRRLAARVVVLATGAYDRAVPVPGWTLPGVFTVGGAQTLLKNQRVLPGRRMLMAGTGPLLLVVASQMAKAGVRVAAVADPVSTRQVLRHAASFLRVPSLARDALRYRWNVLSARVRWFGRSIIVRIDGDRRVERATIARVDDDWRIIPGTEVHFDVDSVCLGYGLVPSIELARLAGCAVRYDPVADVWIPERDDEGRASVEGIYTVGDGARVAGALVAIEEGRIAGLSAARTLGHLSQAEAAVRMRPAKARLSRLGDFRRAIDQAYRLRPGLYEIADEHTVVCRCEEVTAGDLARAVADGAATLNQVKAWTRAGMGPCQARMCGAATSHLVGARLGCSLERLGAYTPRPPVKPVQIAALLNREDAHEAAAGHAKTA